jgi:hypothetical protein
MSESIETAPCFVADEYVDLIPAANRSAPNFVSVVRGVTDPSLDLRSVLCDFGRWFDVSLAVGPQLDVVGEWVGVTRYVSDDIAPFFTFGDPLLGFGQGVWKTTVNPPSGLFALDDTSYRSLIRSKIAANSWDGTMGSLPSILQILVEPDTGAKLLVIDNQDMTMTIALSGDYPGSLIIALLRQGIFPVKPAGVAVNSRITTVFGSPVFGFGVNNDYIGGFGAGAWAEEL